MSEWDPAYYYVRVGGEWVPKTQADGGTTHQE